MSLARTARTVATPNLILRCLRSRPRRMAEYTEQATSPFETRASRAPQGEVDLGRPLPGTLLGEGGKPLRRLRRLALGRMALDQCGEVRLVQVRPGRAQDPRLGLADRTRAVRQHVLDHAAAFRLELGERH